MKQAVIDIGSNSMRLTLYETDGEKFKILFREKIMAGLAGYVKAGSMSAQGIQRACEGLLEFRQTLELLGISGAAVFATAALRNISNTADALAEIQAATGFSVEVLSGKQEALLGYAGAMRELHFSGGVFLDVGGASTEVVTFAREQVQSSVSFAIGSLSLYRSCVKHILPGKGAQQRIQAAIAAAVDETALLAEEAHPRLIGVGGTARAVWKLCRRVYALPESCRVVTAQQLHGLSRMLREDEKTAAELILKLEPERIHTLIPGLMILEHIFRRFSAGELVVSNYGVREGYLCQKLLH